MGQQKANCSQRKWVCKKLLNCGMHDGYGSSSQWSETLSRSGMESGRQRKNKTGKWGIMFIYHLASSKDYPKHFTLCTISLLHFSIICQPSLGCLPSPNPCHPPKPAPVCYLFLSTYTWLVPPIYRNSVTLYPLYPHLTQMRHQYWLLTDFYTNWLIWALNTKFAFIFSSLMP